MKGKQKFIASLLALISLLHPFPINAESNPIARQWNGTWYRQGAGDFSPATLTFRAKSGDTLEFSLESSNGGNTGLIEGEAIVSGNTARWKAIESDASCTLAFDLDGASMKAIADDGCSYFGGVGVTFDGTFGRTEPQTSQHILQDAEILLSQSQEDAFRAIVGGDYRLFSEQAQMVREEGDRDNFGARVRVFHLRGLSNLQAIVMVRKPHNIWAAVVDLDDEEQEVLKYYTNVDSSQSELPLTISTWAGQWPNIRVRMMSREHAEELSD
jgi:hypothetical protein